jgi:hypothetical protein
MTDKKARIEPVAAAIAAAADAVGESKLVRSVIETKVPVSVLMRCMKFLTLYDVVQVTQVKSLRRGLGGEQKEGKIVMKELQLDMVELDERHHGVWGSAELVPNIAMWRRHVLTLTVRGAFWFEEIFSVRTWTHASDPTSFPRLLRLELTEMFVLDVHSWNTLLDECPALAHVRLQGRQMQMNANTDWLPRRKRKQPWVAFSVEGAVADPSVYLAFAHPQLTELQFSNPYRPVQWGSVPKWTLEQMTVFVHKWGAHGARLQKLKLGPNLERIHLADMLKLWLHHWPELQAPPLPNAPELITAIPVDTVKTMYVTWSFMVTLPVQTNGLPVYVADAKNQNTVISQTRMPIRRLFAKAEGDFFHSWTWQDVVDVLGRSRVWEHVMITRRFGNNMIDEKTLSGLVTSHLRLLEVRPCGPVSDALLLQFVERCPQLTDLRLGAERNVEETGQPLFEAKDVRPYTIQQLLLKSSIVVLYLEFGVFTQLDADLIRNFANEMTKGSASFKVHRKTAQRLIELSPDSRLWLWSMRVPSMSSQLGYMQSELRPHHTGFVDRVLDADVYRIVLKGDAY